MIPLKALYDLLAPPASALRGTTDVASVTLLIDDFPCTHATRAGLGPYALWGVLGWDPMRLRYARDSGVAPLDVRVLPRGWVQISSPRLEPVYPPCSQVVGALEAARAGAEALRAAYPFPRDLAALTIQGCFGGRTTVYQLSEGVLGYFRSWKPVESPAFRLALTVP